MNDYISKKKLVNSLKMWLMDLENDMDKGDYGELCENKGAREAVESCICEAEEQPAADVQPVKRGKWIENAGYGGWSNSEFKCPECGIMEYKPTNFCPNCGAELRGIDNG